MEKWKQKQSTRAGAAPLSEQEKKEEERPFKCPVAEGWSGTFWCLLALVHFAFLSLECHVEVRLTSLRPSISEAGRGREEKELSLIRLAVKAAGSPWTTESRRSGHCSDSSILIGQL